MNDLPRIGVVELISPRIGLAELIWIRIGLVELIFLRIGLVELIFLRIGLVEMMTTSQIWRASEPHYFDDANITWQPNI